MEPNKIIAGIDYSMTSPCICVHDGSNTFDFESCTFFYLAKQTKLVGTIRKNIFGTEYPSYKSDIERYLKISKWSMGILQDYDVTDVCLENYAFGGSGAVFNIGENTGILKLGIHLSNMTLDTVAPTQVKKFATGSGRADKEKMHESFKEENSVDLQHMISPNRKNIGNPVSDIVDAYYICKYGFTSYKTSQLPQ